MLLATSGARMVTAAQAVTPGKLDFSATTGGYTVTFHKSAGAITIAPPSGTGSLSMTELAGDPTMDLLRSVSSVMHHGDTYSLSGQNAWSQFDLHLSLPVSTPGEIHLTVALKLLGDPPAMFLPPDVELQHAPASSLTLWVPAAPVAGNSLFLSSAALGSSILYLARAALSPRGQSIDRSRGGQGLQLDV